VPSEIRFRRRIIKNGNSLCVTFPTELVEASNMKVGDEVSLRLADDGSIVVDLSSAASR
jgi:antitoxin component of MazEF toxin-antitoxin module